MVNNSKETVILKVSGHTTTQALKTAVVGYLNDGKTKTVYLEAIGVLPNYVATKCIIMVRGYLSTRGMELQADPFFHDIVLDEPTNDIRIKTGIRWVLKSKGN